VITLILALLGGPTNTPPASLVVSTPRGETRIEVRQDEMGGPLISGPALVAALAGSLSRSDPWTQVVIARQTFEFLLGAPLFRFNDHIETLSVPATVVSDTVYLPFQFVAEVLPRFFGERYRYEGSTVRLIEIGPPPAPVIPRLPNGLLPGHVVTIDPGHGGRAPGNPGKFFPRGVKEKHVTLQVGLRLRDELERRGVTVRMTRTADAFVALAARAALCARDCDLFVSLHVDALDPRRRPDYGSISGFSSYIIGNENTEDADRVARMENQALRYETSEDLPSQSALDFILRDLQMNEYLRESERAGALIQGHVAKIHPGDNRKVHQSNRLAVLNLGRRPAVLFEMGYATHRGDARFLTNRSHQKRLATAIADAIVAYLLEFERKVGVDQAVRTVP
jgi:N-acetylmuramoyl-L-alanine amidase